MLDLYINSSMEEEQLRKPRLRVANNHMKALLLTAIASNRNRMWSGDWTLLHYRESVFYFLYWRHPKTILIMPLLCQVEQQQQTPLEPTNKISDDVNQNIFTLRQISKEYEQNNLQSIWCWRGDPVSSLPQAALCALSSGILHYSHIPAPAHQAGLPVDPTREGRDTVTGVQTGPLWMKRAWNVR